MKKQILFLVITSLFFSALLNPSAVFAAQQVLPGFNPDKLIDDSVFSNKKTMSAAQIQAFLESKSSVLANTSNSFVMQLKEPVNNQALKNTLEDPKADSTTPRTAAELIYDAAQSSGLNPQVILVTLNKEQSLITGRQGASADQIQRALDFAMGFGCPDSQPCGDIYRGFYYQLFGGVDSENNRYLGAAKSLVKSFETPGGRGPYFNGTTSKVGDAITLPNTTGDYDGVLPQQSIVLKNAATAALYRYTPHVFNGNYNFWKFFNTWFGKSTGTDSESTTAKLIKTSSSGDVYIVENGGRYKVLPFVAKLRNLKTSKAKKVSQKVFDQYQNKGLYSPPDNTLIQVDDKYYLFESNTKRPITEQGIKEKGLKINDAVKVNADDANLFVTGTEFSLSDGAVLKGATTPAVYLLTNGKLKLFTYATFVQYNAAQLMQVVPEATIAKYPKDGLVLPKDGSLIKSFGSATVYFYENGQKKPMDGEIFRNRGFSFTNVYELDQKEIDALPLGNFPDPVNNTFFKDKKTGQLYVYRDGKKSAISTFVAKQKEITPDFTFGEDSMKNMPNGVPVLPKEGTLLKGDKKPDVYLVNATLVWPLTGAAFTARGFTIAQIQVLPQAEVDSYPKGAVLTK
jgi:hypothetical protein